MKTLLVPTDFSAPSENALRVAAQIAKREAAQILVVYMAGINENSLYKNPDENIEEAFFQVRLAQKKFGQFLNKPYLKDVEINTAIKKHFDFSEIDDVVAKHNVSLIIMGSESRSSLEGRFTGSNIDKVVRTAGVPVLVVKQEWEKFELGTGVYASDFAEERMESFRITKQFFEDFGATMKMVYVNVSGSQFKSTTEINKILLDFFTEAGYKDPVKAAEEVNIVSDYSVKAAIIAFGKAINADFIAVPTHGRTGMAHLLMGSISEDIAEQADRPVLTIKM